MADGIYLSTDRYQQLNGDLFEQNARQTLGDVWEQQASAAAPDLIAQAQKEADDRARAQMQLEQAQRDHMATSFESSAPSMAAQHLASLNADVAPQPQEAPQPTPAPDTTQTAPDYAAPTPAPVQSQPAPSAPVTAPMSNPVSTQQPISTPAAATPTTAGISGGGDLSGRVGARGQQILSSAADAASWLGDQGQKALQAVLMTEGGLGGARGDQGKSAGPLQFYEGGQLANFAQQLGLGLEQAKQYVEQNPEAAIQWAIGTPDKPGYLGGAIQRGLQAGLQGADLATYAQRHGQVSVSPERAGQNWQSLFGGGQDVISGVGQAVQGAAGAVGAAAQQLAGYVFPVQGYSGDVALHWGDVPGGSDLFAPRGTPVVAMHGGKVVEAGYNTVGGNSVLIQGDDGNQYYYAHFDQPPSVKVGQSVSEGTYLGPVGNTGDAKNTGTHLHIGIGPSILLGADKYGGTGGNFDAVGLLRRVLSGQGAQQATGPAAGPGAMAVPGAAPGQPAQPQPQPQSVMQFIQQTQATQGRMPTDEELGNFELSQPPQQQAAAQPQLLQPSNPIDAFKQKLGDAFSDLFAPLQNLFGGTTSSTPPAPEGGGYGAVPPGGVNPLSQFGAGLSNAASDMLSQVNLTDPTRSLIGGNPVAPATMPTSTELIQHAEEMKNRAIAENNPLRDVPVVGGLTTGVAQAVDPLFYAAGPLLGTAAKALPVGEGLAGTLARGAVQGAGYGAIQGATQPEADVGSTVRGAAIGAGLGLAGEGGLAALERAVPPAVARAATGIPPEGEVALPPNEALPTGPQPGQLDLGLNAPEIHPRIQELFGDAPEYRQIAQQGLDDLVQSGANPTQIGRYFAGLERNAGVNQPELSVGGIGANDWFRALRNGAMAGGLSTLGHVFLNIPLQTVASVPREALASAFRGAPEQIPASLIGLFKGYSAGWEAASQQLRYGLSRAEAATGDLASVTPALRATNPVAETAYNALQGLVSTHGVAQTFMENVGFIQKLTQQAWTMAKNEGLSGSAFTNRVEQIVKNAAIDPQYSDMLVTAQQYGQRMALRGAQGTLGRGARGIAQAGPLGNLLVPFEGIAYNVVTRGIELTPAGPFGTGLDVARKAVGLGPYAAGASKAGAAAVAPVSERLANNVLGLGLLAYGLDLATHGRVVGHGPDDPTERRAWLDQGGQPDSFVVDGQPNASGQIVGGRYISGHLFGQFFYPFATAAAITESQRAAQGKGDQNMTDVMADSVRRLGEYVSNETWLRSVAQITDALKTEGGAAQKLETLAANMAESFVPQTALFRNVEQASDPYARQAAKGDLAGRLATAYPGLAGGQPIRQSLTGEPVTNPNQGVGIFAPTGRGAPDPVIQLFGNAGIGVPPPPTHVRVTSKYEMDLQPDEQRQYQDIRGQALRELTQEFVKEPDFASLPIEKQRTYLQKAMTKADDMARKQFLDQMPDAQIEQRVQAYQGTKTSRPFAYVGLP